MNIVVVGNGSSILESNLGRFIDTFDDVVRFNFFEINGFEQHVGTKTTIWFRNSGYDLPKFNLKDFKQIIVQHVDFPNEWTDLSIYDRFPSVDIETIREIREYVDAPTLNLSTGIQALGYLTRRAGHIVIHGFDSFSPPDQYFQKSVAAPHSQSERNYITHLKEVGLVTELIEYAKKSRCDFE